MGIVADNPHTQYLAEKGFGIGAISHGNGQVVKTKICPGLLPCFPCCVTELPGFDMKGVRIEVCDGLTDEHIGENLITIWCADADTMPNQQPCW